MSGHFIFKEDNFIVFISQSFIEERNDSRCRTTKTARACCTGNAIVNKSSDLNGFDIRSALSDGIGYLRYAAVSLTTVLREWCFSLSERIMTFPLVTS